MSLLPLKWERDGWAIKLTEIPDPKRVPDTNAALYSRIKLPEKRRTALDIGAYHGEWSNLLAKDFELVVAWEVRPENREVLEKNLPENALMAMAGLAEETGIAEFVLRGPYAQSRHRAPEAPKVEYPVHALDDYVLTDVDFIKIDVDGTERGVIYGAVETIWRNKPMIVIETKVLGKWGKQDLLRLIDYEYLRNVSFIDEIWVPRG